MKTIIALVSVVTLGFAMSAFADQCANATYSYSNLKSGSIQARVCNNNYISISGLPTDRDPGAKPICINSNFKVVDGELTNQSQIDALGLYGTVIGKGSGTEKIIPIDNTRGSFGIDKIGTGGADNQELRITNQTHATLKMQVMLCS